MFDPFRKEFGKFEARRELVFSNSIWFICWHTRHAQYFRNNTVTRPIVYNI